MKFLNFELADDVESILRQIGIADNLAQIVADHVQSDFRNQYPTASILSIEFLDTDEFSMEGNRTHETDAVDVTAITMPINLRVRGVDDKRQLEVNMKVCIGVTMENGRSCVESVVTQRCSK